MRKWRERLKRCSYKPRNAWSCQKLEETRKDSLPEPSEGQHLDVGCLASRTGRINFCVLRHQACGDLSQQPSDTKCRSQVQWVAEGGSVWPQVTCFLRWMNGSTLGLTNEWGNLITAEDQYGFNDKMQRREIQAKKKKKINCISLPSDITFDTLNSACSFIIRAPALNRKGKWERK